MFQRAELDQATAEDEEDRDDERPTVVVLKSGDLTEEEAEKLGAFPDPDSGKAYIHLQHDARKMICWAICDDVVESDVAYCLHKEV